MSPQEIKNIFSRANAIITGDHFVYAKKETGWFHGSDYVNKDAIYPYTAYVSALCKQIAEHILNISPIDCYPSVVVGPTVGGVALAQWTAYWLSKSLPTIEALAVCADEEDVLEQRRLSHEEIGELGILFDISAYGKIEIGLTGIAPATGMLAEITYFAKVGTRRVVKRGYDKHVKGKRCLIVEDVINSGITVAKTRDAVIQAGGEVVGVGCLCNRSGGKVTAETLCIPELFSLLDVNMQMFPEDDCPICKERGPKSVRTDLGKGKEFLVRKGLA